MIVLKVFLPINIMKEVIDEEFLTINALFTGLQLAL